MNAARQTTRTPGFAPNKIKKARIIIMETNETRKQAPPRPSEN
jgi:hypothetical protein